MKDLATAAVEANSAQRGHRTAERPIQRFNGEAVNEASHDAALETRAEATPQTHQRTCAALVWFRRDLRLDDHAALGAALAQATAVYCAFVFDTDILAGLPRQDRRVSFIWQSLAQLRERLLALGGDLLVRQGSARDEIPRLALELKISRVYAAEDYEPQARERDRAVAESLGRQGGALRLVKDQVIFAGDEVLTQAGRPFRVYTPYRKAWLTLLSDAELASRLDPTRLTRLARPPAGTRFPELRELGFEAADLAAAGLVPGESGAEATLAAFLPRLDDYAALRDFPARASTSGLATHNRFGTISIRRLVRLAHERAGRASAWGHQPKTLTGADGEPQSPGSTESGPGRSHPGKHPSEGAQIWLSELIWREFFFQVLHHHPQVARGAFRPAFDRIAWPNDEALFAAWCRGRTGYPLVDAAMRELVASGSMHNRLRMVVAAFLCKDLLIDWRWGERFFALHLNDFDLAANNGNWQWAASTGCDAQPWFRIFNPLTQARKFDPRGEYVRAQLPELRRVPERFVHAPWTLPPLEQQACGCVIGRDYPAPVVDHAVQRQRALALYREAAG